MQRKRTATNSRKAKSATKRAKPPTKVTPEPKANLADHVRTVVGPLSETIGVIRIVTPQGTIVLVSEVLSEKARLIARALAAHEALEHIDEGAVKPIVVLRTRTVWRALDEAKTDPEPFPQEVASA